MNQGTKISTYQPQYQQQIVDLILPIQRQEFGSSITLEDQPDLLDIPTVYQQCLWLHPIEGRQSGSVGNC